MNCTYGALRQGRYAIRHRPFYMTGVIQRNPENFNIPFLWLARCKAKKTRDRKNSLDWTIKKTQAYEIRRVFFSFKVQSFKFINRFAIYSLFYQALITYNYGISTSIPILTYSALHGPGNFNDFLKWLLLVYSSIYLPNYPCLQSL